MRSVADRQKPFTFSMLQRHLGNAERPFRVGRLARVSAFSMNGS